MAAGETNYETVVEPGDYENINPYTADIMPQLIQGLESFMGKSLDGSNFMDQFFGDVPRLQGITSDVTSPFEQRGQEYIQSLVEPTTQKISNLLSQMGGARSSAMPRMIAQEMNPMIRNVAMQRAGLGAEMFGGLARTAMPLYQQQQQTGLQAAGMLGGIADPSYVGPEMAATYKPGFWDYALPVLGSGGDFMSGLADLRED